jgi:hypothetical protein
MSKKDRSQFAPQEVILRTFEIPLTAQDFEASDGEQPDTTDFRGAKTYGEDQGNDFAQKLRARQEQYNRNKSKYNI